MVRAVSHSVIMSFCLFCIGNNKSPSILVTTVCTSTHPQGPGADFSIYVIKALQHIHSLHSVGANSRGHSSGGMSSKGNAFCMLMPDTAAQSVQCINTSGCYPTQHRHVCFWTAGSWQQRCVVHATITAAGNSRRSRASATVYSQCARQDIQGWLTVL